MNRAEIEVFAHDFFAAASIFVGTSPKTFTVSLGDKSVQVNVNEEDNLSQYIQGAFITSEVRESDFRLDIWRTSSQSLLPKIDWARNYLAHDNLVPPRLTHPFRIAFDKSQGFIFLYDTENKRGSVWIADDLNISLNSFVTPFRVIFSWMAESFGGEIIHASAIAKDGKSLIINGPSGSGKSTLALLCALAGFKFIADDVVLYHDGLVSAIYRYAKVDSRNSPCDLSRYKLFQMAKTKDSKDILDLNQLGENFQLRAEASALVLPIFAHLNQHARILPAIAIRLLAPNSLRELMGGTPYNFKNLANLTQKLPSYRVALSTDNHKNIDSITFIFGELS